MTKKRQIEDYSEVMKHETSSNNYLKSYIPKPSKISFEIQDRDEEIILILRQHPITQVKSIFILLFSFLFVPSLLKVSGLIDFLPEKFRFAFYAFIFILFLGMTFRSFLIWFFNVYIITDERIIDVDFLSMIYKNISTAKTENIEDVTKNTSGIMASLFDYGTIYIQTAAAKNEFEFEHVPHPAKVVKLLNELVIEEERERIEGRVN
ncbi:MAG: hypothetical protein GX943_02545 [Candidatus Pacebacteria bacterium]|jgi:hypothetical protein|nr:hypothetical protein [Candidatus Paceibacterota bacterium]